MITINQVTDAKQGVDNIGKSVGLIGGLDVSPVVMDSFLIHRRFLFAEAAADNSFQSPA